MVMVTVCMVVVLVIVAVVVFLSENEIQSRVGTRDIVSKILCLCYIWSPDHNARVRTNVRRSAEKFSRHCSHRWLRAQPAGTQTRMMHVFTLRVR